MDRSDTSLVNVPNFRNVHDESLEIADDEEQQDDHEIVIDNAVDDEPETMEITPQIPMFDLGHFMYQTPLYQENQHHDEDQVDEEQPIPAPSIRQVFQQHENEDFYICKLPSCQTMIQFENCGARSKILNHYTSHFQRELESAYGHLLTADMQCTLCNKDLKNFIKSKVWIHIGVTHDKTNDILIKKGIEPIRVNIRMKRKASDAFRDDASPPKMEIERKVSLPMTPSPRILNSQSMYAASSLQMGQIKANTCKICGQVTQNRKRLLKHYCTKHYMDRLSMMELSFIEKNRCTACNKDFIGAKKSSKVIHIGLEHRVIYDILDEEFGKDGYLKHDGSTPVAPPPLKKIRPDPQFRPIAPKIELSVAPPTPAPVVPSMTREQLAALQVVHPANMQNMPRVEATMSERMKEIQDLGNTCYVCGKEFDLFRSMLLPHYCGHFYKEIAQGHEDFFTEVNCKLCGATATKRKSRIIHLGVKHELVLPYIEDVLKSRNLLQKEEEEQRFEEIDEEGQNDDNQNEFVIDESEIKSENEEHDAHEVTEVNDEITDNNDVTEDELSDQPKSEPDEPEEKIVTPIRIKMGMGIKKIKEDEDSGTDVSQDGMTICKIIKDEKIEIVPAPVAKVQNKEVWITPAKSKSEVLSKYINQQNNVDNQDKPFHLNSMFNDSNVVTEDNGTDLGPDEVTAENLGLVCKICEVVETSDHELLTHYCSHFDNELKEISAKMIDDEHKCVECHKMLGNNKRRLYHFGVKHLKVIPLINQRLRAMKAVNDSASEMKHSVTITRTKKKVDESVETEEDDFEITYDNQPNNIGENSTGTPANKKIVKSIGGGVTITSNSKSGGHKNPRLCELCGCKRNTSFNLLLHCTKQHFLEEIRSRWGHHIQDHNCELCDEYIDTTTKNVGEAEKWIHLGHKHGKTNQLLREKGKRMIIIKGFNDHDFELEHSVEPMEMDSASIEITPTSITNNVEGGENSASSEDDTASSPPPTMPNPAPTEYNCPMCDKTTKNQNLLDLHLIAIHFKKELLQKYGNPENTCEFCKKTFQNVDAFAFHIGKDHDLLKVIMQSGLDGNDSSSSLESSPEVKTPVTKAPVENKPSLKPLSENPSSNFVCFKCGAKRRGMKELYGHYSLQHFSKELMEEFGVQKKCTFDDCNKNLENGTAWVSHLGKLYKILTLQFSNRTKSVSFDQYLLLISFRTRTSPRT